MRKFATLSDQEILALAISNEEEDARIYADFAYALRENYPDTARIFTDMVHEENEHRRGLIDLYVRRFGSHIPLIRRQDIAGFPARRPAWQVQGMGIEAVRGHARQMELEAARFYRQAALGTNEAATRKLLGDLAVAEDQHEQAAGAIERVRLPATKREGEDENARRRFVLQVIQPGLVGLMDGSVSTLAPVFAAAFATHRPWEAFLVGIAASVGAGISMGFAEALSDDGKLSGRGAPVLRGAICGLMTTAGGIGHTVPFLIDRFSAAMTVAVAVVVVELVLISWVRWRYQDTPFGSAVVQIVLGGALVFATGILIGSAG
ncbi:Rubrerythrin [Gluconacetobacter diazotrophicus PA1 5]|uniref:Putative rubrerythrin protein n=1 Tax=Gluconacetobacter diazotrophicus (strain ATCC 49037 / DSM 5601 / CCUG 37298 / CIP 103539 / LMG 7603 / PAl5) TaxID=272568 RepID=A9H106_GLUDA|nr:ferritin family protein [Gluconacetobacter diazotrophicus]ACI52845.1 Rubrerythrin [Gluconacetobacter diazotrophicus PA1 5]TWB09010.1 rubrerythrin [Gluconacetobacter diazotrophicus]CAP57192.1 putative rubrerythrin protein [Gluconacetobacter diazotrophicus PA1 5]